MKFYKVKLESVGRGVSPIDYQPSPSGLLRAVGSHLTSLHSLNFEVGVLQPGKIVG